MQKRSNAHERSIRKKKSKNICILSNLCYNIIRLESKKKGRGKTMEIEYGVLSGNLLPNYDDSGNEIDERRSAEKYINFCNKKNPGNIPGSKNNIAHRTCRR